ncbi:MAG: hypothetical protein AAFQ42_09190 [Pseudomonadota bacterium]
MTRTIKTTVLALAFASALGGAASAGSFYGDGPVGSYPDWAQRVLFDTSN